MQSEHIEKLAAALCKVQGELDGAKADSVNPHFKSNYADLRSVWSAIRDLLAKNKLAVVQTGIESPIGYIGIETTLMHESGQWISGVMHLPSKRENDPQQYGSALTYARRYSLAAIVGVYQEDDDANLASKPKPKPKPSNKAIVWDMLMDRNNCIKDDALLAIEEIAKGLGCEPKDITEAQYEQIIIELKNTEK